MLHFTFYVDIGTKRLTSSTLNPRTRDRPATTIVGDPPARATPTGRRVSGRAPLAM